MAATQVISLVVVPYSREAAIKNLGLAKGSRDHFPGALAHWARSLALPSSLPGETEQCKHRYDEAFETIDNALLETGAYLAAHKLSSENTKVYELSQLWLNASRAVSAIDPEFAETMCNQILGWTDPDFWNETIISACRVELKDIENTRSILNYRKYQVDLDLKRRDTQTQKLLSCPVMMYIFSSTLFVLGIICVYGGIQLIAAPVEREFVFNVLGFILSSKQVGATFIALGAATIILIFRRVLRQ